MRDEIVGLLEKADVAVASAVGVVPGENLEPAARAVRNGRVRLSYPPEILVVALVGGTGSGKSSLANAICGTEVAEVGGVRPTTGEPLALIPPRATITISGYLDEMGIKRRKPQKAADWLCLIDMPDIDSVELDNRLRVDELLPRLDVVVWVLDPEKYRDAVLHHKYLAPLAPYASQFVFVLNQADRLHSEEIDSVLGDLQRALTEDGIESGTVVVTAADPPNTPPQGVGDLVAHLETLSRTRAGCYHKLLVDLEEAAAGLLKATGGTGIDFERRAARAVSDSAELIADERPGEAVNVLKDTIETFAREAHGPAGDRLMECAAAVPGHVQGALEDVLAITGEPDKKWIRWSEPKPVPVRGLRVDAAAERLSASLVAPMRLSLMPRAQANAAIADLALSAADVKTRALR